MNVHVFYVLELKTKKNSSVRLSVRPHVRTSICVSRRNAQKLIFEQLAHPNKIKWVSSMYKM